MKYCVLVATSASVVFGGMYWFVCFPPTGPLKVSRLHFPSFNPDHPVSEGALLQSRLRSDPSGLLVMDVQFNAA